jgi:Domain of unknown function (DUF4159)
MLVRVAIGVGIVLCCWGLLLAQRPFKEYPAIEYNNFPLPPDADNKTEWTRARLRYTDVNGQRELSFQAYWTMDYPRSDRHLLQGIRRLTRIDTRSVEQVVDLDGSDDIYNWPYVYGVEVGHMVLSQEEANQMREYLNRGGFFMVDDFHGGNEWEIFKESIERVFPDRPIVDIPNSDPIFHTVSDLDDRFQVPGWGAWTGDHLTYEPRPEGDYMDPHWRGIYDDKGRLVVVICHNMDLGDAWEHSDDAIYPEKFASLAYRIAVNYAIYDLTH